MMSFVDVDVKLNVCGNVHGGREAAYVLASAMFKGVGKRR